MGWLSNVNWDSLSKTASAASGAANAISTAANSLGTKKDLAVTGPPPAAPKSGSDNTPLLLLAVAFLFKKMF
jgi:hypothetical protein